MDWPCTGCPVVCSSTVVSSDHKPLFASFDIIGANISLLSNTTPLKSYACKYLVDSSRCDSANVGDYQAELDCCLNKIKIPMSLIGSTGPTAGCNTVIDEYYDNVVKCISIACKRWYY